MTARICSLALVAVVVAWAVRSTMAETLLPMADKDFLVSASLGGKTEVILGDMATQKGLRNDVKEFGKRMVKDHTEINNDLNTLTVQKGLTLPAGLGAEHQMKVDKLKGLTGQEFDAAYISEMLKDHQLDAQKFKTESATTKDADIKTFVDKTIPIVDAHLKRILTMEK